MWKVDPAILCRKHLLGEHLEMHMFVGSINKGKSLKGFIDKGLVEISHIIERHDQLRDEMIKRGFKHQKALPECELWLEGNVDVNISFEELKKRCPECRTRILNS